MAGVEPPTAPPRLADVPLPRYEARRLLNLHERRDEPDHDYYGYGWSVVERMVLEDDDGGRRELGPSLLLALHSADEQPEGDDIELELDLPGDDEDDDDDWLTVLAPLGPFLDAHLPRLPAEPPDVVLALCNPAATEVSRPPPVQPDRRLHFAHGDVTSWLDVHDDGTSRIRLHARSWHQR